MLQRVERLHEPVYAQSPVFMPRLFTLRRVSRQCRRMLPLNVMKRYQCVVIGMDDDALTIAIVDARSSCIFHAISILTGRTIFPVLIDVERMQLLLRRIERAERGGPWQQQVLTRPYIVDAFPLNIHTMLQLLTSQEVQH